MSTLELAVVTGTLALSEAAGLGGSAHALALSILRGATPAEPVPSRSFAMLAVLFVALAASGDALRALARGLAAAAAERRLSASSAVFELRDLTLATALGLGLRQLVEPRVRATELVPLATGVGLSVLALVLVTTSGTRARRHAPGVRGAVLLGLALGSSTVPGFARASLGLSALLFVGLPPARALVLVELALVPHLVFDVVRAPAAPSLAPASVALLFGLGVAAAALGYGALSALARSRRLGWLALWLVPLGVSLALYGWVTEPR